MISVCNQVKNFNCTGRYFLKGEQKVDFFKNLLFAHPLKTLFDFFGLDAQRNQVTKSNFYFYKKTLH